MSKTKDTIKFILEILWAKYREIPENADDFDLHHYNNFKDALNAAIDVMDNRIDERGDEINAEVNAKWLNELDQLEKRQAAEKEKWINPEKHGLDPYTLYSKTGNKNF